MILFLKNLFLPTEKNGFCPAMVSTKAIMVYATLALAMFISAFPSSEIGISRFLADLTQQIIIQEVNPKRLEYGVASLKTNDKLSLAAQMKADDMIKRNYFSHTGPEGETPWSWFEKLEYEYAAAGENLAINFSDPRILVEAWLNSPAHAKNIYNGYFTDMGIGIAKGQMGQGSSTVVVMFLGRELTPALKTASVKQKPQVLANAEIIEEEMVKLVPPEDSVVKKLVKDEDVARENMVLGRTSEKIGPDYSNSVKTKLLFVDLFSLEVRLAFTVFLNILILWLLITFAIKKERPSPRLFNSFFLLILMFTIWLPEVL